MGGCGLSDLSGRARIWRTGKTENGRPRSAGQRPPLQALLTQLGNPKAVLFFGALLPQFLDLRAPVVPQYAEMFAIIMIGETIILGFYGWLGSQGARLARGRYCGLARAPQRRSADRHRRDLCRRPPRMTPDAFVRENAALIAPPLVPELRLHLATEVVPLWRKTEEELAEIGVPPPYWAFAWAGGQALARYVLDNPALVAGKRVMDFGAGSGLVALAAARAGAASVMAADIDGFAVAAIRLERVGQRSGR